jgi:hypothetical protein
MGKVLKTQLFTSIAELFSASVKNNQFLLKVSLFTILKAAKAKHSNLIL